MTFISVEFITRIVLRSKTGIINECAVSNVINPPIMLITIPVVS